jgi:hypothetical protein
MVVKMSQLVKSVMAKDTGQRKIIDDFRPIYRDMVSITETMTRNDIHIAQVYDIRATIGARVAVSDYDAVKEGQDVLKEAIKRTKEQIIEAVFGEFREDFMRLEMALYDRDFQKSRIILDEFRNKMFSDE